MSKNNGELHALVLHALEVKLYQDFEQIQRTPSDLSAGLKTASIPAAPPINSNRELKHETFLRPEGQPEVISKLKVTSNQE